MKQVKDVASTDFPAVISEAERAVANVKDESLRDIAFERILDHLLSTSKNTTGFSKPTDSKSDKADSFANVSKSSTGPLSWLIELHEEGFFKEPKSLKNVIEELNTRSHLLKPTDLTKPLQKLCHDKKLRRNKHESVEGGRKVFHWYNW